MGLEIPTGAKDRGGSPDHLHPSSTEQERRPGLQRSQSGTKKVGSGEQNNTTHRASGEVWQSQAARRRGGTAVVRRKNGSLETVVTEEDEDGIGDSDGSKGPRGLTGPSAPLEYGTGEKTRTAAVPIGDEAWQSQV
ncbi:hypothetical protein NDU88_007287 [Pleurodeles waltl]|uniref:Uncharacterized protein n=1 Tax=Pleurodeles waltl TaxID=8319 RepID=A0AAV7SS14_PLEWA|nr:hypothetical protein NDU88_007287 [Pleurodeles waltl]